MKNLIQTNLDKIKEVLTQNNLSFTQPRQKILDSFFKSNSALCHSDIEKHSKNLDRITIYRTLQTFLKKGIIHTIPSTDDTIFYALCHHNSIHKEHSHNHLHFNCIKCHKTMCLEGIETPNIPISNQFIIQEIQLIAKGICNVCNEKK